MTTDITITEHIDQRPNGDRDPARHDCYKYDVAIGKLVLKSFDQFDHFHTCIEGTPDAYLKLAQEFATDLAHVSGLNIHISPIRYEPPLTCPVCGQICKE